MTALLMETARDLTKRLDEGLNPPKGERQLRQLIPEVAVIADLLAGLMLSIWRSVLETLERRGFEGQELAGHCRMLLEGIDYGLGAYERLLAKAEESGLTPEAALLPAIEAKLPALREARPQVAEVLALATRPPRPIDEAKLAESRAARSRGEFVNIDEEYLTRLRAGEDF